jgi:uncharacterized protein (TIGR00661 family)
MAKIFVSLSGDGRGHATRVRALAESLRQHHLLIIYTSGQAYDFLARVYAGSDVQVRAIPGLNFGYNGAGKVRLWPTLAGLAKYLQRLPLLLGLLRVRLAVEQPDLVISDFEPALPRAARQMGIPHISLNHQHFLLSYDLRSLPAWLRLHAIYMGWVVRAYDSPAVSRIVSSFFFPPLRPGCDRVTQTGVLLRPTVLETEPSNQTHLVAYWRRQAPAGALEALAQLNREVHIYGLGQQEPRGRLRFLAADEDRFVADLASCAALVCTAGNQLVGEAIYLRKPVLAIPEPGNYEQYVNAHFLGQMHAGTWVAPHQFTIGQLRKFLDRAADFRSTEPAARMHGLPAVLSVLRRNLGSPAKVPMPSMPAPVAA